MKDHRHTALASEWSAYDAPVMNARVSHLWGYEYRMARMLPNGQVHGFAVLITYDELRYNGLAAVARRLRKARSDLRTSIAKLK